ncbi:hypothetical protein KUTeg_017067 [Tegillarca granosa]|uniref:Uncharacterized protein n=1 Tax=Tegillarca granosa TaxID=220873 RepID=A0ABQ9ESH1_TEGGR|nr:hypothetical protein KUTeg_017067 [Tegillarca granosa]
MISEIYFKYYTKKKMGNWKLEVGRTGMMPPETPKWKYIEAAIRAAEKQKEKEMELEMERYLNAFVKNEKKSES